MWIKYHFSWFKQMKNSYVTICICNFNTTKMTNDCIASIVKNIKSFKYKIILFDNSNKEKFKLDTKLVNPSLV